MKHPRLSIILIFILVLCSAATESSSSTREYDCVYNIFVKTGNIKNAGTDSRIGLSLGDSQCNSISVSNLETWGLMPSDYDYFERGNLDAFSGGGICIVPPICSLHLTSDDSGNKPGWFVNYVEIFATGPNKLCTTARFYIDRWLAVDEQPYELYVNIDECKKADHKGPFVLGNILKTSV
ncbi:hypothetical protein REPUB_Repub07fG0009400 [Reevesia pubescens]